MGIYHDISIKKFLDILDLFMGKPDIAATQLESTCCNVLQCIQDWLWDAMGDFPQ